MKVLKFGGSSIGNIEAIAAAAKIVSDRVVAGEHLAIVVSAMQKVTDQLIAAAKCAARGDNSYQDAVERIVKRHTDVAAALVPAGGLEQALSGIQERKNELLKILYGAYLVRESSTRTLDLVMSFGERISAFLLAQVLSAKLPEVVVVDARELIVTDGSFGMARVFRGVTSAKIVAAMRDIPGTCVITGFIGATEKGETTSLGRGGSDYTAALIGEALKADEIEIWTDVDGVMTADPRRVRKAFPVPRLSYKEAMELSHFGAKVIYPPTMRPALDAHIPIRVKNTFNPSFIGTVISETPAGIDSPIVGISSISKIALLRLEGSGMMTISGVTSRLFGALAQAKINVLLISQASSEHSICFAVDPDHAGYAKRAIEREFSLEIGAHLIDEVVVESELSVIAVVGEQMRHKPGISARLFESLGRNGINVIAISQGSSELNISVVINRSDEAKALNALHDAFFLSDVKTIHLFLVGTGQVGATLLEQIKVQLPLLKAAKQLDFQLVGIANSRKMIFNENGITLPNWRSELDQKGTATETAEFTAQMLNLNLPNSIFIDCTASDAVAEQYEPILSSAISIVTPNKRANSGTCAAYTALKNAAARANVKFFYETNVGAGLPVIGTLNDLLTSGDEIVKIEAVLSGTLSYIFNTFRPGTVFSAVVKEAKERGYTEPDPRDDLSGRDVARKLLILAREMGLNLEDRDVSVESLVPEQCRSLGSSAEFMQQLPRFDSELELKRSSAEKKGAVLRYIAQIHNGDASVALQSVGADHPFFNLSGSDNIISFTTKRYNDRPLVVKGPGAGTEVTAAGVFADIVRVASYLS